MRILPDAVLFGKFDLGDFRRFLHPNHHRRPGGLPFDLVPWIGGFELAVARAAKISRFAPGYFIRRGTVTQPDASGVMAGGSY
jgi:hypothetical protein